MLLSALLLAAAVQAAPTPPIEPRAFVGPAGRLMQIDRVYAPESEARAAMARREACRRSALQWADTSAPAELKRLGDLPMANHTLTVLRSQDGCPISSTIRYNVGR